LLAGIVATPAYAFYTWFLWLVLFRSVTRQLISRDDWTKTEREPVDEIGPSGEPALEVRSPGRPPALPARR